MLGKRNLPTALLLVEELAVLTGSLLPPLPLALPADPATVVADAAVAAMGVVLVPSSVGAKPVPMGTWLIVSSEVWKVAAVASAFMTEGWEVMTEGWAVTTEGWAVMTEGMPVTTPRELVELMWESFGCTCEEKHYQLMSSESARSYDWEEQDLGIRILRKKAALEGFDYLHIRMMRLVLVGLRLIPQAR